MESFDASRMRADVLPLVREKNELDEVSNYPVLPGIPVHYVQIGENCFIKPFYQRGDLVWVGFSTFDISNSLGGGGRKQEVRPDSKIFGLENACLLGRIAEQGWSEPTNLIKFENGRLVLKVGSTELSLSEDGVEVTGNLNASGEVSGDVVYETGLSASGSDDGGLSIGEIKAAFNNHIHNTTAPGAPTGTPVSQIQE
ncbi:Gp138 family membrane-puncturing spike protein [Leptospira saintgironsiae]|uniref:Gp138 family membrane-puncturing spike protein n=1 Tax=Leptospira saintgironsiae TaxID=2023183 RepID=UPI001FCAFCDC|nr:Gp138 family membrane-puncturing spike protein [Leptospira saintgironsiae]